MTEYASAVTKCATAEELIAGDLGEGEYVTLPSGKTVKIRGLSRHELIFSGKGTEDSALIERRNVVACLIDPKLTIAQVEEWQRHSLAGGDFKVMSEKIRDLSGLGEGADKSDSGSTGAA